MLSHMSLESLKAYIDPSNIPMPSALQKEVNGEAEKYIHQGRVT